MVAPLQSSLAVGAVKDGVAVQFIVAGAPAAPIVGGVVSIKVIVWLTVAEWLPHASTASQVLVTVFAQPVPPVTSLSWFTVAPLQSSLAVGAVKDGVAVQFIVAGAPAAPIVGGVVSIKVIVWLTVAEWLPHASTASQVLVTVFAQPVPPVTSVSWFTVAPLQSSLAVGAVKDGVAVQLIVAGAPAAPIVGGVVSIKVIVWLTVAEWLPHAST